MGYPSSFRPSKSPPNPQSISLSSFHLKSLCSLVENLQAQTKMLLFKKKMVSLNGLVPSASPICLVVFVQFKRFSGYFVIKEKKVERVHEYSESTEFSHFVFPRNLMEPFLMNWAAMETF
ncbi:hypothetical protein L2E82_33212 [Cichorium intybus]|uniref:Uncharacterized protein n=1 Tax=Cichorium intybus TaxID=13427 RepID=A0ACB9BJS8_CICIN|nr:hypothetical protein L2E82_33212 [Cichorium intybus]